MIACQTDGIHSVPKMVPEGLDFVFQEFLYCFEYPEHKDTSEHIIFQKYSKTGNIPKNL